MKLSEIVAVDRLVSKAGMAMRARMIQQITKGISYKDFSDKKLVELLYRCAKNRSWIDAAAIAFLLWRNDWTHHLGRDFIVLGEEPEHQQPSGF